jgi:hypothetical protein
LDTEGKLIRTADASVGISRARSHPPTSSTKEANMLWTLAAILLVLWALGLVSSYTMGGFIHILLVLAVIIVLVRVIRGAPVI